MPSIYFDLRVIEGSRGLFNALQQDILARTAQQELFLLHLAKTALERTAPLGFFKNFILEQDGKHKKGLDLKKRGISLITDLVGSMPWPLASVQSIPGIGWNNWRHSSNCPPGMCKIYWMPLMYWRNCVLRNICMNYEQGHDVTNLLDPVVLSSFATPSTGKTALP